MYYSAIGILAVLILLIENQDILHSVSGNLEKPAWLVYRRFLIAVLAYYVTDILWGMLEGLGLSSLLFADTTVVVLTAYNWDDIAEEAHRVGVDSFLTKPLFAANVIEEFERIARRNNMALLREKKRAELSGRRVLLAEDMAINAEIIMDILEMEGMEADHAENGRIAVEMFENSAVGSYAAILMDVRMPEMDGLEAAAAIRALDRADAQTVPIIALTANAFDEDVQLSLQAGMNAHLTKPIDPKNLSQALGELIYSAENGE